MPSEEWEPALHCIDAILEIMRALERPAEDIAGRADEPSQRADQDGPLR